MSPGRRARSGNWGTCMTMSSIAQRRPWPFTGKRQTSMSKAATRRTKAARGTISQTRCVSSAASMKRGRKSAGRSNANAQFGHAVGAVEDLVHPRRHRDGRRQPRCRRGGAGQGHRLLPGLPPRRRREPRRRRPHLPRRDPVPARRRPGPSRSSSSSNTAASSRPLAPAASSAPCKPSSPAAATAASPTPRIWTTPWPPKSCS